MRQTFSITHREGRLLHRNERNDVPWKAPRPENPEIADKRAQLAQLLEQYKDLQHVMPQWQNPERRDAYARHMRKVEQALEQHQRNSASLTLKTLNALLDPNRDGQSTELPQLIRYLRWLQTPHSAANETQNTATYEDLTADQTRREVAKTTHDDSDTFRDTAPKGWKLQRKTVDRVMEQSNILGIDPRTDRLGTIAYIQRLNSETSYGDRNAKEDLYWILRYWPADLQDSEERPLASQTPETLRARSALLDQHKDVYRMRINRHGGGRNPGNIELLLMQVHSWYFNELDEIKQELYRQRVRSSPQVSRGLTLLSMLPEDKRSGLTGEQESFLGQLTVGVLESEKFGDVRLEAHPHALLALWRVAEKAISGDTNDPTRMWPIIRKVLDYSSALFHECERRRAICSAVNDRLWSDKEQPVASVSILSDDTVNIDFRDRYDKKRVLDNLAKSTACAGYTILDKGEGLRLHITLPPLAFNEGVLLSVLYRDPLPKKEKKAASKKESGSQQTSLTSSPNDQILKP